jgi:hypothetical protein
MPALGRATSCEQPSASPTEQRELGGRLSWRGEAAGGEIKDGVMVLVLDYFPLSIEPRKNGSMERIGYLGAYQEKFAK